MKNCYTSVLLIFVLAFTSNAQTIFYDDFESYPIGQVPTCEIWSTSDGDPGNGGGILVVNDISIDNQSGYVGPGSVQDVMLDLRNQTSGEYTLQWEMYITGGSTGYFNIQGMTEINISTGCQAFDNNGVFNSSNIYFNNAGAAPGVVEDQTTGETGTYPEDSWFPVSIYFDLTVSPPTYQMTVDDNLVNANPVGFQDDEVLGGIDFFSIDANNHFWLDNVHYYSGTPGPIVFEDDFESYDLGDMGTQNPFIWSTWDGDPASGGGIIITTNGGSQVGYIGPNSGQDALLILGNITAGIYQLDFLMYITGGSTGYFNIQGETETNTNTGYQGAGNGGLGVFNSGNLYFNQGGGAPGTFEDQTTGETASYPEDVWFPVSIYFDVDNLNYTITINGNVVNSNPVPFQEDDTLGAINFFSIDANNNYWLENLFYFEPLIFDVEDFSPADITLFPNPVTDILNIQSATVIDEIRVYDVLGKLVIEATPETISPSLDVHQLSEGVYLVKVTIGNTSKTVKIIKY